MSGDSLKIPVDRIKPIIERAIADRNDEEISGHFNSLPGRGLGGHERVSMDIALATKQNQHTVSKMLQRIKRGWDNNKVREPVHPELPATEVQKHKLKGAGVKFRKSITMGEAAELEKKHVPRREVTHINFRNADDILTGLGLTHLWYTELYDLYEGMHEGLMEA